MKTAASGAAFARRLVAEEQEARWLRVVVKPAAGASRDALVEGLLALGGSAVEEPADALATYIPAPTDAAAFQARAEAMLHEIAGGEAHIEWQWQQDEDWSESWKRGLRARRVGRHFVVTPSWSEHESRDGDHIIVIDPEMAFGTGEHGTTRGALRFLEQVTKPGDRVLDVGTGSAILAIGAAQLGAREVIAVDNDPDAILNARDNITRNHVDAAIALDVAMVDESFLQNLGAARFEVVAANVLSSVLKPLLRSFYESVVPGGHVILGGILEEEADDMLEVVTAAGFNVIAEDLEDEWWGVLLQRH
jgi:ribosomal protein L11 methyltransferase